MQNHSPKVALVKNCSKKFQKFHRKEPLTKSCLSKVVECDFTEKELHYFLTALKVFQNTVVVLAIPAILYTGEQLFRR